MKTISTPNAPAAVGPYAQGNIVNGLLFASGQIALVPETGELAGDTIEAQSRQVMKNVGALLEAAGTDFDHVVKTTCFLDDINDFGAMNEALRRVPSPQARTPPAAFRGWAALPQRAAKVEIKAVAYL